MASQGLVSTAGSRSTGRSRIGITAGASAPPHLVDEVLGMLRALGPVDVVERVHTTELVEFNLPKEVTH